MQFEQVLDVLFRLGQLRTESAHATFPALSQRLAEIGRPINEPKRLRSPDNHVRIGCSVPHHDYALAATNAPRDARGLHDLLTDLLHDRDPEINAEAVMLLNLDLGSSQRIVDERFSNLVFVDHENG